MYFREDRHMADKLYRSPEGFLQHPQEMYSMEKGATTKVNATTRRYDVEKKTGKLEDMHGKGTTQREKRQKLKRIMDLWDEHK